MIFALQSKKLPSFHFWEYLIFFSLSVYSLLIVDIKLNIHVSPFVSAGIALIAFWYLQWRLQQQAAYLRLLTWQDLLPSSEMGSISHRRLIWIQIGAILWQARFLLMLMTLIQIGTAYHWLVYLDVGSNGVTPLLCCPISTDNQLFYPFTYRTLPYGFEIYPHWGQWVLNYLLLLFANCSSASLTLSIGLRFHFSRVYFYRLALVIGFMLIAGIFYFTRYVEIQDNPTDYRDSYCSSVSRFPVEECRQLIYKRFMIRLTESAIWTASTWVDGGILSSKPLLYPFYNYIRSYENSYYELAFGIYPSGWRAILATALACLSQFILTIALIQTKPREKHQKQN